MRVIERFRLGEFGLTGLVHACGTTMCTLVLSSIVACGGGTTGTSPSDGLRFNGFAEKADGSRAAGMTMTVRSGATDEELLNSGTNAQGEFSMDLPSSEQVLVLDVSDVGAITVARSQQGDGLIAAKLSVTSQKAVRAEQMFEAQVDQGSLCTSVIADGNTLLVTGDVGQGRCPVTINITSEDLASSSFIGTVTAMCGNMRVAVVTANATESGQVELDLNKAFSKNCTEPLIAITSSSASGLRVEFPVEE